MKIRLILLLLAFIFAISAFGQHEIYLPWEFAGGPPCPMRDVVLHQGTLYAGTDCGLYKRPESGGVWEQQPDTPDSTVLFMAANAGAVVAVFQGYYWQYNVGYYALDFFNSTDHGASFVRQHRYAYNYWYDTYGYIPVQTTFTRLYALGDSSFALGARTCDHGCRAADLVSTDQGQHWAYQFLASSYYSSFLPHFASQADTVAILNFDSLQLVAASNFQRIASRKIAPTFQGQAAGLVWTNDRITVAFPNGRYAYTDNLGQSWTADSVPLADINDFFYYENHYYWCAKSGFYRSPTVGPAVLETLYTHPGPLGEVTQAQRGTGGWYILANGVLLWLPDGSNEAMPVATDGLDRADGKLSCLPGKLMFQNDHGLWWQSPDGNNWSVYENETAHTQRFQELYVGDTFCLAYAAPLNSQRSLYRSVDGGYSWSLIPNISGGSFIKNQLDDRVYVHNVFTADGGLTWDTVSMFHLAAALGDTLLARPERISFDHGQHWQSLALPTTSTFDRYNYYAYPLIGRSLYAFPIGWIPVYRSLDFGNTWEAIGTANGLGSFTNNEAGYLVGQNTWLTNSNTLAFSPPPGQSHFLVGNTPFSRLQLPPGQFASTDFGRIVQKDSTVYAARRRGVWRISDCYTEHPSPTQPVDSTICQGNFVVFHGDTLRTAGTYMQQIPSLAGLCDSMDVLRLQINLIKTYWEKRICPSDTLLWNGQAYSGHGTFIQQLSTATGCDSSVTLYLGAYTTNASINVPLCAADTLQLNGQAISTPGQYTFHLTGFAGCDSTLVANVYEAQDTINLSPVICAGASYWHSGQTFTQAGEYWITRIFAIQPCPTIYHILLTVQPDEVITLDTFVTVGTVIYGQIMHGDTSFTVLVAGPNNCDKIVTINAHTTVGLDNLNPEQSVQAFPNPFRDQLTLRWPGGESAQVRLYDARGQLWREARLVGPTAIWDTGDLPAGLYRVEVRVGGRHFAWKLVKMP